MFNFRHKNLQILVNSDPEISFWRSANVGYITGIRLIKRNRTKTSNDVLHVIETFSFDIIQQISPIRNGSTIELRLTKKRITIHSHRV
jgi:hypothetical protein